MYLLFLTILDGYLIDRFGFRNMYFLLLSVQLLVSSTMSLVVDSKFLYCLWVTLSLTCEGGHFILFPSKTIEYLFLA